MKRNGMAAWTRIVLMLAMVLMLCTGVFAVATAANDPLKPADVTSADGNIKLHKQAERIGPEVWEVNVWAEVAEKAVSMPELEVAFLLDRTASMNSCTNEEEHTAALNAGFYNVLKASWHINDGHT